MPFDNGTDLPRTSMVGTRAVILDAPGDFEMPVQRRIWALADEASGWPEVEEVQVGVTNLMAILRAAPEDPAAVQDALVAAWHRLPPKHIAGRLFEIPTAYGGALGEDLAATAAHAGLSPAEVVRLHSAGEYTVCAIGSSPGFGYLHGLDPRLFMPRKTVPSLRMLAGTVTIGGMQAGISVNTGPNGWNAIGFTDVPMFDPHRDPPALLAEGDRIRFVPTSVEL